jgi:hypothetical protein
MDWRTLFNMQHSQVHTDQLEPGAGGFSYQDLLVAGLNEEEVRLIPATGQNSIAWLLWHMTRCEDVATNLVLAGRSQVLDEGWGDKIAVGRRDIGTGMTPTEVAALSQQVDLDALIAYRHEVAVRTRQVVDQLEDEWLDQPLDDTDVEMARAGEVLGDHAGWVGDFWQSKPRRWFLWLPTGHCYQHIGEALTLRSLAGRPGTR